MKRWVLMAVAGAAILGTAACGGGTVAVQAILEGDTAVIPLRDLEVRALPYDRDAIFDSLATAYGVPEPPIPDSLADLQQRYVELNQRHAEAQDRWLTIRDSLKALNDQMGSLPPASPQYRLLYLDFQELSGQEGAAKREMDSSFAELESIRTTYTAQVQDIKSQRNVWAEQAYKDFTPVKEALLEQLGRAEVTDTTDANGVVVFRLKRGDWWIHARYDLPFEELYWNVPIQVAGDPKEVVLNRETAQVRPKY